jgi:hypothetical protein
LLLAGDGVSNSEISEVVGISRPTVLSWRSQFEKDGLVGFGEVAKGRGPKPSISEEKVAEIVNLTLHSKPEGETHWSCRSMAKRVGVSPASVQRIWSARGLKPHLVKTFTLSHDRHFEEKLVDVVGLYLNPPDQAVVLCMDEKSQIQALDRTQPSLPLKKGRAGTMTHDYKRHGTTTLFAALNVLTGVVIGRCLPRHRNTEFLKFLRVIDREVPTGLQIHMICDTHKVGRPPKAPRPGHEKRSQASRDLVRGQSSSPDRERHSKTICVPLLSTHVGLSTRLSRDHLHSLPTGNNRRHPVPVRTVEKDLRWPDELLGHGRHCPVVSPDNR